MNVPVLVAAFPNMDGVDGLMAVIFFFSLSDFHDVVLGGRDHLHKKPHIFLDASPKMSTSTIKLKKTFHIHKICN